MNDSEAQEQLKRLEPYHTLSNNPHFQKWVDEMNTTLADLDRGLMLRTWDDKRMKSHLTLLGLSAPKDQEDELRLYIALKAVLGFWKRKLDLLEKQTSNYEQTKRKLLERSRNGDDGRNRSVTVR